METDLFPNKMTDVPSSAVMDSSSFLQVTSQPLEVRISDRDDTTPPTELFPNKVAKSLEDRISFGGAVGVVTEIAENGGGSKSLADRIQVDSGPAPSARELFPNLLTDGGNRKQRRRRAEDHF
jgi:hypothetical protein